MQNKYQSPWFVEALQAEGELKINKLKTNLTTDICIIGGGFTGLWTALKIKEKKPSINITIIEKDLCGSGASGRNGGCMIPQSTKFTAMKNTIGIKDAKKMVSATEDAVYNIRDYCLQNNIDAKIRMGGVVYGATNKSHKGAFENLVEDLKENQINSILSFKDKNNIVVKTKNGSVACQKLIFAINAWTPTFLPFLSRSVILVSSDMIISEPIKNKLEDLKLNNGLVVLDSNLFTHYCRTTPDGRIMLGKGGNTFAFRNKVIASFDGPSTIEKFLEKSLVNFFPSLNNVKITKSWNGPSERTKTGFPFFGYHPSNSNISYGFGYSGNGVLTCYVGGEILSSMALNEQNRWTESNFCKGPLELFPPEPFRWIGAMIIRNAVRRKEKLQEQEKRPWWIDKQLAKLAVSVGRVDFEKKENTNNKV